MMRRQCCQNQIEYVGMISMCFLRLEFWNLPIVYAYQLCGRPRRRDYKRRIKGAKHWGKGNNEIQNIISFYQKKVFFDSCINYYNHSKRIGILGRIG
jgi:hypothetical protein